MDLGLVWQQLGAAELSVQDEQRVERVFLRKKGVPDWLFLKG